MALDEFAVFLGTFLRNYGTQEPATQESIEDAIGEKVENMKQAFVEELKSSKEREVTAWMYYMQERH